MGAGESVAKAEASTQTEPDEGNSGRRKKTSLGVKPKDYPQELLDYTPEEIKEMLMLYKDKQDAIDRSSIRGVQAKRDLYNALDKNRTPQSTTNRPRLDPNSLHRQNHPKGYLTKITTDYEAKHDEELSVQKGTMVKVLRNHKDGRYEVYTAGGFGLVPGKVLAYIQYEPDYN
ncbi:hypothetical protein ACHWQZ_G009651 [Mnemiopsis leidyi]